MKIKISYPTENEAQVDASMADCYPEWDEDAIAADGARELFDAMAAAAKGSGLAYAGETDFGGIWQGTEAQCAEARNSLPAWAIVEQVEA